MEVVMEIITDCWEGVFSNEESFPLKNVEQLVSAIDALNGKNKTLVGLSYSEDTYLTVGGGNEGRYVVTGNKGDTIYNLMNPSSGSGKIEIVAGGQGGIFDEKLCINKTAVIQASLFFYKNVDFDKSLSWEIIT
jgi:hypothetical protein